MDNKSEQPIPEKNSTTKSIKLDSGENAKEYKNYLVFPDNTVIKISDPLNPQNPNYNPNKISFAQKNLKGSKFGPTATGSWKQEDDPFVVNSILKIVSSKK